MQSRSAKTELRRFLQARGLGAVPRTPREAVASILAFFDEIHAADCRGDDHDMLLYQWGTYDWGKGLHFDLDITRQFIADDDDENDEPWQLHLTFRFPPSAELGALGDGNRWCRDRTELPAFREFVVRSPAFVALADRVDGEFELLWECAG